jgi:DNA-binding Xre family transcriptional regulator
MPTNDDTLAGEVANAIRAELARQHKRMVDLAPVLHVSRATIYRRFDAAVPDDFDLTELEKIARFLACEVQDIFDSAELGRRISAKTVEVAA